MSKKYNTFVKTLSYTLYTQYEQSEVHIIWNIYIIKPSLFKFQNPLQVNRDKFKRTLKNVHAQR